MSFTCTIDKSRSSHPYRRAAEAPGHGALERGREFCRSPRRSPRKHDGLLHASDDWERRRSRSPRRAANGFDTPLMAGPDPVVDFCCRGDESRRQPGRQGGLGDPMMLEASCFDPEPRLPPPCSPKYVPVSDSWRPAGMLTAPEEIVFGNTQQQAPDEAVIEYLDLYSDDLPQQAVRAIQSAARMGNEKLVKILEAVVQEADALGMEA